MVVKQWTVTEVNEQLNKLCLPQSAVEEEMELFVLT